MIFRNDDLILLPMILFWFIIVYLGYKKKAFFSLVILILSLLVGFLCFSYLMFLYRAGGGALEYWFYRVIYSYVVSFLGLFYYLNKPICDYLKVDSPSPPKRIL